MKRIKKQHFFSSWSGGKDACLAYYYAKQAGGVPKALLTMFCENEDKSRSHRLPMHIIESQARSMGIKLVIKNTSRKNYEENLLNLLRHFKDEGINIGVFGDIDLQVHLDWIERVCAIVNIRPIEPLWKIPRKELLQDFLQLGFSATIVAVRKGVLDKSFLGERLNKGIIEQMESIGIDACGECGEYHTVVTDGPIMSSAIEINFRGEYERDGYYFLDIE